MGVKEAAFAGAGVSGGIDGSATMFILGFSVTFSFVRGVVVVLCLSGAPLTEVLVGVLVGVLAGWGGECNNRRIPTSTAGVAVLGKVNADEAECGRILGLN